MVILSCTSNSNCPFLFQCVKSVCEHNPIFPLTPYTIFVYCLLPFGVMLTNVGGLSPGVYKVPILMDLLNYTVSAATTLSYPIVTGAGLGNLLQLIPKRNPFKNTSLVDYNIVLILIPSTIYGSTLGAIVVTYLSQLVQDTLLMVIMSFFAFYFFKLWYQMKEPALTGQEPENSKLQNLVTQRKSNLVELSVTVKQGQSSDRPISINESQKPKTVEANEEAYINSKPLVLYNTQEQLKRIQDHESGYHFRDIFISIVVFTIFEIGSLFSQGKFYLHFTYCDPIYWICIGCFTILYVTYIICVKLFTNRKMQYYKDVGYKYNVRLQQIPVFMTIFAGGFIGGFVQSLIGCGSGHSMVMALTYVGVQQKIASGTSSYQIFFIGLSSLIQAKADHKITWQEIYWFFSIVFVFGGILTFMLYRYLGDRKSRPIPFIIGCICLMSILGTIPSIAVTQYYYGWPELLDTSKLNCHTK